MELFPPDTEIFGVSIRGGQQKESLCCRTIEAEKDAGSEIPCRGLGADSPDVLQKEPNMQNEAVSLLRCPICSGSFRHQGNSLICEKGHCYDIARDMSTLFRTPKARFTERSFLKAARLRLKQGCSDL